MPLSKPVPRKQVHTREIQCHGYLRDDGLWDIEGSLLDTKAYSFESADRGHVAAGEPIHHMWVRLTIDSDFRVHKVEAVTDSGPFDMCGNITPAYRSLEGLRIEKGWRKQVLARLGGVSGCTHLTDLLSGPLAVTAFQTLFSIRQQRQAENPDQKPGVLDTCHALGSNSPVVKQRWPQFYSGD